MNALPPIPAYGDSHALVVHFPIALLFIAPVFIILGLIIRRWELPMFMSAFLLFALGTAGAAFATSTGEAAADAANLTQAGKAVLEQHEELAELSRNLFIGVTGLMAALTFVSWKLTGRFHVPVIVTVGAATLLFHAGATLVLANAAHEGGRLVHEMGVRGPMFGPTSPTPAPMPGHKDEHVHEDHD